MTPKLTFRSSRICSVLLLIASGLFIVFISMALLIDGFDASVHNGVQALFNMNAEVSIPTWFSQSLLFVAAGLLFEVGASSKRDKGYWYALSVIFIYLSIDEGAAIHELFASPLRNLFGIESGLLFYSWILLFGFLLLIIGLIYIKFLLRLPKRTSYLIILSGLIFVSGAIGFEMIGASLAAGSGEAGITYALACGIEELLEMMGSILFIYTLLDYMQKNVKKIEHHFTA